LPATAKKKVLFVCRKGGSLSQMAAGFLTRLSRASFEVHSATFEPQEPSPLVMHVMSESGLDTSDKQSKCVSDVDEVSHDASTCRPLRLSPSSLRLPYGSFFDITVKILSIFSNFKTVTPISTNDGNGFTGRMLKITNVCAGPYGFTGKIPYAYPVHCQRTLDRRGFPRNCDA
jgi:hypothetical protein